MTVADKGWLILISEGTWHLAAAGNGDAEVWELPVAGDRLDDEQADALVQAMRQRGYAGSPVALGVPSSWLLTASISTDNLPRSHRHQAMVYRLEEHLPVPAEELVADFAERNGSALGVAVPTERLTEIIERIEAAQVPVQSICPATMLALQGMDINGSVAEGGYVAMAADGRIDLVGLAGGRARSFQSLPDEPADLARSLRVRMLLDPPAGIRASVASVGLDAPMRSAVAADGSEIAETIDRDPMSAAASAAAEILTGRRRPWFELRRGPLAGADRLKPIRRPLAACFMLAIALLCALTAGLLWRAHRYNATAGRLRHAREDVFTKLYPGQPCPEGVRRRLESNARQLGGLREVSADVPGRRSALESLRAVVARLPGDVRLHVQEMQIEPDRLVIEGKARSHGDAERIAAGLRAGGVFDVQPPRTERLVRGDVSFTIAGTIVDRKPAKGKGKP